MATPTMSFDALVDAAIGRINTLKTGTDPVLSIGGLSGKSSIPLLPNWWNWLATASKVNAPDFFMINQTSTIVGLTGPGSIPVTNPARLGAVALMAIFGGDFLKSSADLKVTLAYDISFSGASAAAPNQTVSFSYNWQGNINISSPTTNGLIMHFPMPIYNASGFGTAYPALGSGVTAGNNFYPSFLIGASDPAAAPYARDPQPTTVSNITITVESTNTSLQSNFQWLSPQLLDSANNFFRYVHALSM